MYIYICVYLWILLVFRIHFDGSGKWNDSFLPIFTAVGMEWKLEACPYPISFLWRKIDSPDMMQTHASSLRSTRDVWNLFFHWWHALGEIEGLTRAHLPPMNWPYQSTSGDFRLCDVCLLSVKSFGLEAGDNVRQTMHHWHQPYRACQSGNDNDLWHLQTAWNVELLLHQPAKKRSTQLFWSLTTAKFHIITKSQQDSLLFFFSGI